MNKTTNGPFKTTETIILASGSPRRRELLADLGLDFEVHPSTADEPAPLPDEDATQYAKRMAEMKTLDVATSFTGRTVLGADTIVVLDGQIMGKPADEIDALAKLTSLSGKTHQVITAFCLFLPDGNTTTQAVSTDVDMRASGKEELESYIATGEPMDKAGAYAIQGIGTFLVTAIRGSYTNVVGLPVARVLEELLDTGIIQPRKN
ncbi:Maf family protein [uncultured Pseudodesulfovibrio sp.]|uniref:Maf family protein n=1 Tax=uncultured Pseudodesulfovibrio sp. TaxID=2035858 RepID=UPI0029C96C57|nr:Maf family protein [uncultured Pseudodesulfovibrio sp.]